ncbi:MAG: ribonuclease HII [Myxococcota bacterium]
MSSSEDTPRADDLVGGALPQTQDLSIGALRDALSKVEGQAELERWVSALAQDSRAGARALGERTHRRRQAEIAEAARLKGLFELRSTLFEKGCQAVAGVDEVGVGPLAGPVVAAAVVLPAEVDLPGLNDSKKLSAKARERLDQAIREQAVAFSVGEVSPEEIDRMNILQATLEAMRQAISGLQQQVSLDHVLVDARKVPGISIPQTALVHGDAIDGSIAAASIVAKVYRDALMQRMAGLFPGYGLDRHMGYGTAEHIEALGRLGASSIHRRSFAPVAAAMKRSGSSR